jgi:RHS repeat-associated protein
VGTCFSKQVHILQLHVLPIGGGNPDEAESFAYNVREPGFSLPNCNNKGVHDMAFGSDGNLYLVGAFSNAGAFNRQLIRWDGTRYGSWGGTFRPPYIEATPAGSLVATCSNSDYPDYQHRCDYAAAVVEFGDYGHEDVPGTLVAGDGTGEGSPGAFSNPRGLALSSDGSTVFVGDHGDRQIKASYRYPSGGPSAEETATCNFISRWVGSCDNSEGNPVSTRSGALHETFVDLAVPGPGAGLAVRRGYSTLQLEREGPFGHGWSSDMFTRLLVDEPYQHAVTILMGSGAEATWYELVGTGRYDSAPWVTSDLEHDGEGSERVYTVTVHDGRQWTFDASGLPLAVEDRNGYENTYHYATNGELEKIVEEATGREISFTWDGDRIEKVTDPAGRSVTYGYNDGNGNLTDVWDVDNGHWHFVYDSEHRLTHKRDPYQSAQPSPQWTIVNEFDAQGRVEKQTDAEGQITLFDYDSVPNSTVITLPGNNAGQRVKVDEYNPSTGQRVRSTEGAGTPDARTVRFEYDAGRGGIDQIVLESVSPERTLSTTTYDTAGNIASIADVLGRTTVFEDYNDFGTPGRVVHSDGAETVTQFDAAGNVEASTTSGDNPAYGPVSTSVSFDYHPLWPGLVETMTDPRGKEWSYDYDTNGYQDEVTDPLGHRATMKFDDVGRIEWQVAPKGNLVGANPNDYRTTFETNAFGQVTKVTDPLGNVSESQFDELGRVEMSTDADLRSTQYRYDDVGRVIEVERNDSSVLGTEYWPDGSLKAQIDAALERTEFYYDALGQLRVQVDPLERAVEFAYRADGTLWWRQDPGGNCEPEPPAAPSGCQVFTHDDGGQLTSVAYHDPHTADIVDVVYDDAGRRESVVTTDGTLSFAYDGLGRLRSSTEGGLTVAYTYDPAGLVETVTYPGDVSVTRGYDDAGRWVSVTDWDQRVFTFEPDEHGNVEEIAFPGAAGLVDVFEVDRADRLEGIRFEAGGSPWATIDYGRSDAGLLESMTQTGLAGPASEAYTYDALGRLKTAGGTTFNYDPAGNLTTRGGFVEQRYDEARQLCMQVWPGNSQSPGCDDPPAEGRVDIVHNERGERVERAPLESAGPPSEFVYDAEGRLVSATVPTAPGNYGEFTAVTPQRLVDTRPGSGSCPSAGCVALEPDDTIVVQVADIAGVPPAGAVDAVSLSVTTEGVSSAGWLVVYSADVADVPEAASAHFVGGEIATVGVLAKVGSSGEVKITNHGWGTAHVAVDVTGWFAGSWGPSGGTLTTVDPTRIYDSAPSGIAAQSGTDVAVAGVGPVPSDVGSLVATVTVTDATANGPVVVYSTDETQVPDAVSVTAEVNKARSSLVTVPVGADGKVRVHNGSAGTVEVTVDVVGYASGGDPSDPDGGIFAAVTPQAVFDDDTFPVATPVAVNVPVSVPSPSEVTAVALTVTVGGMGDDGSVVVWPGGADKPTEALALSYQQGATATATVVVALDDTAGVLVESSESGYLRVDVAGYWFGARYTYGYDYAPDGLRSSRVTPDGTTTTFGWDRSSGLPLLVSEHTPGWWVRYVYGPGGIPLAQISPLGATLLHRDQLGSIRAATDPDTGNPKATFAYDAWGKQTATTGAPWVTRFGYAGEYTDTETGLVYLRARHYDPTTATFATRDPLEATTRDPYGYAAASPHNYTDPTGLRWCIRHVTCPKDTPRAIQNTPLDSAADWLGDRLGVCSSYDDPNCDPDTVGAEVGLGGCATFGCVGISVGYTGNEGWTWEFAGGPGLAISLPAPGVGLRFAEDDCDDGWSSNGQFFLDTPAFVRPNWTFDERIQDGSGSLDAGRGGKRGFGGGFVYEWSFRGVW